MSLNRFPCWKLPSPTLPLRTETPPSLSPLPSPPQAMPKSHVSSGNGICVAIHLSSTGKMTTSLVTKNNAKKGQRMCGYCIHHVGGSGPASLTPARRKAALAAHKKSIAKFGGGHGRCEHHVTSWKKVCASGAM